MTTLLTRSGDAGAAMPTSPPVTARLLTVVNAPPAAIERTFTEELAAVRIVCLGEAPISATPAGTFRLTL